jgi:hypothetical protein
MNLPGFNAETTLYRTAAYQTAALVWTRTTANHLAYPQIMLPPPLPPGRFTTCTPCDPTSRTQTCTNPLVARPWQQQCSPCCSSEYDCQRCDFCQNAGCLDCPQLGVNGCKVYCPPCHALMRSGQCDKRC